MSQVDDQTVLDAIELYLKSAYGIENVPYHHVDNMTIFEIEQADRQRARLAISDNSVAGFVNRNGVPADEYMADAVEWIKLANAGQMVVMTEDDGFKLADEA